MVVRLLVGLVLALAGCEAPPSDPVDPIIERGARSPAAIDASPRAEKSSPSPSLTTPKPTSSGDALVTLQGNIRNAIAWAPLSDPDDITVEGSVPRSRAWSTSKVLVIAAYLDDVVDGDPTKIPAEERGWIQKALTMSDGPSIIAIQDEIDDPGDVMTGILRDIGDNTTTAPDSYVGTMQWTVDQQVRFMAALGTGRVVSPEASRFLLQQMQPIASQRWGLASIGATAFKPGWVGADTETRQMGVVGDYAHQWQLDRLARLLAQRIQ